MKEIDIAWAAGLFEGEGSFYLHNRPERKNKYARAQIFLTDKDVLEKFYNIVGVGYFSKEQIRKNPKHKNFWIWAVSGYDNVKYIYELFLPYLGERRTETGRMVLEGAARRSVSDPS